MWGYMLFNSEELSRVSYTILYKNILEAFLKESNKRTISLSTWKSGHSFSKLRTTVRFILR